MATFTTNYNLRKPATSDLVDVTTDLNANFDTIDTEIKEAQDSSVALDLRVDSLETKTAGEAELTTIAALTPAVLGADWTVTAISFYRIGRMRFVSFQVTYGGATITPSAAGNIIDTSIITGLPVAWRPVLADAHGSYTVDNTHQGDCYINTLGDLNISTLHANGNIASGKVVRGTVSYIV